MTFEETKQRKLKRMLGLQVMNWLGMVAWRDDGHGEAKQHLRLLHPLSWFWFFAMVLCGILSQGIPRTVEDLTYSFKHDTVWI